MCHSFPRIYCVAKQDPELIKLSELTSSVIEKFTGTTAGKKNFSFYDHATDTVIGLIEVIGLAKRPSLIFEEGFVYQAVDLTLRYVSEERHL